MLTGYKTYICSVLGIVDVVLMFLGYVSANDGLLFLGVIGFGSIAGLRAALKTEILDFLASRQIPPPADTTQQ